MKNQIIKQSLTIQEIENVLNNSNNLSESQLNAFRIILNDSNSDSIQLVKVKGKYYLMNGHHRAVILVKQFSDKTTIIDCDVLMIS